MRSVHESLHRRAVGQLMRSRARTFYLASLFLPVSARKDVAIAYAYFRTVDDLVDEQLDLSREEVVETLASWEDEIIGRRVPQHPIICELLGIADRHRIPYDFLTMVIDGARFDLDMQWIETLDDLVRYSVLVAGSVGVIMAHILGTDDPRALEAANDLGVAMQLTNVLRDVGEDLQRGRVYLPRAELQAAGCTLDMLRREKITPQFQRVMQALIADARERYRRGMSGISYLDRSAQFSIYLAATLYSQILVKIERRDFDVFSRRASLSHVEKWMLALPAYAQHRQLSVRR